MGRLLNDKIPQRHGYTMTSHPLKPDIVSSAGLAKMPSMFGDLSDEALSSSTTVLAPPIRHESTVQTSIFNLETVTEAVQTSTIGGNFAGPPVSEPLILPSEATTQSSSISPLQSDLFPSGPDPFATTQPASITTRLAASAAGEATPSSPAMTTSQVSAAEPVAPTPRTTLQTSLTSTSSMASQSTSVNPTEIATPECQHDPACAEEQKGASHNRGTIVGPVLGAIAFLVLVFAAYMLFRRRRRRNKQKKLEAAAIWSDKSTRNSQASTNVAKEEAHKDNRDTQERGRSRIKSLEILGEPGPTIPTDGALETLHRKSAPYPPQDQTQTRRASTLSRTWSNASSDPFRTPPNQDQPNKSRIGLALTRYSTADTTRTRPVSPIKPQKPNTIVLQNHNAAINHNKSNRTSTLSAQTDGTARDTIEAETEQPKICKARLVLTARRHSFTPRIINIVAGQNGSRSRSRSRSRDGLNSNEANTNGQRRISDRARSASPAGHGYGYAGSPAKLNAHFGIETWGMGAGRTSSERGRIERAGSGGSTRGRQGERTTGTEQEQKGGVSYPPSSYPKLGRTLSAVKRTIRADKERAFSGTGAVILPETVTVDRRGGRARAGAKE
ncbi:hypothetical protein OHC33_007899 [Knufia fluminis]|uniref:Uncharacterized protein n=2 Tax=Knufia TaxID=430999 RepID=A0AAN8F4J8_9EURO|nr:hypothetical protein OHC33_007899 [Knufia fluminis]